MTEPTAGKRRHRSTSVFVLALLVVAGLGAYLVVSRSDPSSPTTVRSSASQPTATGSAPMAPNGTFTTPSGATATIASLRGKPTMVWFVAAGCASCAASIPAVAQRLAQLSSDGVQVVTLGLYGDFSSGKQGVAQLLSFGRAAAGTAGMSRDEHATLVDAHQQRPDDRGDQSDASSVRAVQADSERFGSGSPARRAVCSVEEVWCCIWTSRTIIARRLPGHHSWHPQTGEVTLMHAAIDAAWSATTPWPIPTSSATRGSVTW
jgi:cytochrome oxidase Cu insertion factor (SCO1/SenC/PrrC family)